MALLDGNNDVVLLKSNPEFSIYSIKGNEICLFVVPERVNMNLSMYLDLSMASDYTELLNGVKNQMQVVEKLDKNRIESVHLYLPEPKPEDKEGDED